MDTAYHNHYQIRPATLADVAQATGLFNQYSRWLVGAEQHKVEDIETEWNSPGFNPETDARLVIGPEGQPVAYIEFWDMGEPHVRFSTWGLVLPEHQGCGLGSRMLDWADERARQALALSQEGARVVLHQSVLDQNQAANALFTARGYHLIRNFYRMQIDLDQAPASPQTPEGIVIRSIEAGEERLAIRCAFDSFHDHWGFIEEPFDNYYSRWMHFVENDKDYDRSLWFMALEGDQVAGVSLCYSHITEDPDMGWVGTLGVRRNWRRKGLGLALLQHSFEAFYQRGKPRAGLGVDATSLTGATRLYERAGMRVARKSNLYELELRPGVDLLTQAAAE